MSAIAALLPPYLDGPAALRRAVAGLSREQLLARPVAGKWSTLEVVCHLADFAPILADRMKRILSHDRPTLAGADENRFAATLAYHERDLGEGFALIELTHSQMAKVLRGQPDEALDRIGVHTERGELTLRRMLELATNHIGHHLPFIADKRAALGA